MHEKKTSILDDVLKYWPLISVIVISIGGYATLTMRVANAEDKVKDIEGIKISQARMEQKQNDMIELLKDIKRGQ